MNQIKVHPWLRQIKKIADGKQEIELLQSVLSKTKTVKKEAKNSLTGKRKRQSYKKTELKF